MEKPGTEVHMSKDAEKALEILDWIKENAGVEEFTNYGLAYGYIKSNGYVSPLFLSQLEHKKKELEKDLGKK